MKNNHRVFRKIGFINKNIYSYSVFYIEDYCLRFRIIKNKPQITL